MLAGWPQCRQSSRGGWAYAGAIEQEGKGSPYLGQKFWSCSMTKAFKDAFEDGCMDGGGHQRTSCSFVAVTATSTVVAKPLMMFKSRIWEKR